MNPIRLAGGAVIGLLVVVVFLMTYFTVDQNEMAVVTRFGHMEYVAEPELHFKMPFVNGTQHYRTDIQSMTSGTTPPQPQPQRSQDSEDRSRSSSEAFLTLFFRRHAGKGFSGFWTGAGIAAAVSVAFFALHFLAK